LEETIPIVAFVPVMMFGAIVGVLIGAVLMYRLFDSWLFPAAAAWPSGVATAECMIAGDRGGKHALLLGAGGLLGCAGILVGVPMDVFGICWIGNICPAMFGLLSFAAIPSARGVDIQAAFFPRIHDRGRLWR
jgi:uncharacterized oligopeptide transporter (OPT) family protein